MAGNLSILVNRGLPAGIGAVAALVAITLAPQPCRADPKPGGTITMAQAANINTLDPHFSGSGQTRNIATHIYEGLMALDENANAITDLAEGFSYAPDGLSVTFRLRHGVRFHNGTEMQAVDVAASLERYKRLSPNKALLQPMLSVDVTDPYTVVLRLSRRAPTLVDEMASPATLLGIMPAADGGAAGGRNSNIGTGPFKLTAWVADSHATLERAPGYVPNPNYQKRDGYGGRKTAYFDRIIVRVVPEAGSRVAGLETGEYQIVEEIPAAVAASLAGNKAVRIYDMMPWWMIVAWLNNSAPPTDNVEVRQAIQAAINQKEVMAFATQDFYRLNYSFQYPTSKWYPGPEAQPLYNQGNPARARALLAKAGQPAPKLTVLASADFDVCANAGLVVAEQLKAAGFVIDFRTMDHPTYTATVFKPEGWNIEVCGVGIEPFLGAYAYNRLLAGRPNFMQAYSPALDAVWTQILSSDTFEQRKAGWVKLESMLHEQAMVVKLGDAGIKQAAVAKVAGFVPFRSPRLWDVWFE